MKQLHRREAMSGMLAAVAGLAAAPAAAVLATQAAPTRPRTLPDDNEYAYDPETARLTPSRRRLKWGCQALLLAAAWELEDSLTAVLDLQDDDAEGDDDDSAEFFADAAGIRGYTRAFVGHIEADLYSGLVGREVAERERRQEAVGRGEFPHGCALLWSEAAMVQARATLEEALDRLGDMETFFLVGDCTQFLWLLDGAGRIFEDELPVRRLTPAQRQARRGRILGGWTPDA